MKMSVISKQQFLVCRISLRLLSIPNAYIRFHVDISALVFCQILYEHFRALIDLRHHLKQPKLQNTVVSRNRGLNE